MGKNENKVRTLLGGKGDTVWGKSEITLWVIVRTFVEEVRKDLGKS